MKNVFYFVFCTILTLPMLSCSIKTRDVTIMDFPRELACFLEDLGVEFDDYCGCGCDAYVNYGIDGDISYRNREPIEPDRTVEFEDCEGEPIRCKPCFSLDRLDKHKYTIKSYSNGGFLLSVNAEEIDSDFYDTYDNCKFIYKKIVFVHPLQMPYDSVVCTNLLFDSGSYGFELMGFDCRPCAGEVKVYRVDRNKTYLLREMVEASAQRTIWKEYDPNGNVKSIKTISNNPQNIDEDGFSAEPYVTNIEYYVENGQGGQVLVGERFAALLWISLAISFVILLVAIYFIVQIHKRKFEELEAYKKLRILFLVLLYIVGVNYSISLVGSIVALANNDDTSFSNVTTQVHTESIDHNEWIYGEWECYTPYGTMTIVVHSDGTMWDSIEERSVPIDIEEDRIWADFGQYGSSYPLDRSNKRIGTGTPGHWFHKVQ